MNGQRPRTNVSRCCSSSALTRVIRRRELDTGSCAARDTVPSMLPRTLVLLLLALLLVQCPLSSVAEEGCEESPEEVPAPPWKPSVPSLVLRRAIANMGDMILFDRFLEKVLIRREPVTVVAIGSSCTSEFGGRKGPQLQLLNLDAFDFVRVVNPDGWLTASLDWLTDAYPPSRKMNWENSNFTLSRTETDPKHVEQPYWLINLAIGAVGPRPWGQCLGASYFQKLPKKVDLVVVEWALAASHDEIAKDLEKVLQKLLNFWQDTPAIIFVNFFFWCRGNLWCREFLMSQKTGQRVLVEGPQLPLNWDRIGVFSFKSFDTFLMTGDVTEDEFRIVAQYYGLPMISMRDAFWYLAAEQVPGFGLHDLIARDDMGLHPGIPLARSTYGNVLINFFRTAIKGFWRRRKRAKAAAQAHTSNAAAAEQALSRVPFPMFARQFPEEFGRGRSILASCYSYEMWDQTPPTVRAVSGFEFTKDPESKIPKPGFATWKAGSFVEYVLDTNALGKGLLFDSEDAARSARAFLEVRFLVSYNRMGKAVLECIEGCTCAGGVMDATIKEQWSVPQAQEFEISQSPTCVVKITSQSGGGGDKFKILSLSLSFKPS